MRSSEGYYFGRLRPACLCNPGVHLDLPTYHRVPVTWLLEHGSESIRLRTRRELAYPGTVAPEAITADEEAVGNSKMVQAVVKKQKDNGVWGGNLLGLAPSAKDAIKDVGTIPQYRRLLQLGLPHAARPYKLADRVLYRLLSRDEDPFLQFECAKLAKDSPAAAEWAGSTCEAAAAALVRAGYIEIRGCAGRPQDRLVRLGVPPESRSPKSPTSSVAKTILNPEAHPPPGTRSR